MFFFFFRGDISATLHKTLQLGMCVFQFRLTDFMNIGKYDLLTCCAINAHKCDPVPEVPPMES